MKIDRIIASAPQNATAAKVLGKGTHFSAPPHRVERTWPTPPQMRPVPHNAPDLIGKRSGRLTVVGIAAEKTSGCASWVVRCDCGNYEYRKAKAIKHGRTSRPDGDRCGECDYREWIKSPEYQRAGTPMQWQRAGSGGAA